MRERRREEVAHLAAAIRSVAVVASAPPGPYYRGIVALAPASESYTLAGPSESRRAQHAIYIHNTHIYSD